MANFNELLSRAVTIMNEMSREMNTSTRVGSLFRDIVYYLQNILLGIILKGEKGSLYYIKIIENPSRGDTWKAIDTGSYWTFDGTSWNDIGSIIPTDVVSKDEIVQLGRDLNDIETTFENGNNILRRKYCIDGKYINPSGILADNASQGCVYMFPVKANQKYIISRIGQAYRVGLYDSNKNFISFITAINSGGSNYGSWVSFKTTSNTVYISSNYILPMPDDLCIEEVADTQTTPSDKVVSFYVKNDNIKKESELKRTNLPIQADVVFNAVERIKTPSTVVDLTPDVGKVFEGTTQIDATGFTSIKIAYNDESLLYSGCMRGANHYAAIFLDANETILGNQHAGKNGVNDIISRELIVAPIGTKYICFSSYDSVNPLQIESAIINSLASQELALKSIPSNESVFHSLTTFGKNLWIKDFIIDLVLITSDGKPVADRLAIGSVNINVGGNTVITVCKVTDINALVSSASANQVCYILKSNWQKPETVRGRALETLSFTERDGSGVTGYITVDWNAVPDKLTTNSNYNTFYGFDTLLSDKVFKSPADAKPSGYSDTVFQLEGINCRLITSNGFQTDNTPDWLFILILGNSSNVTNNGAMPTASALQWFREHRITLASIQIQDSYQEPFAGNTGWGNGETVTRVIKLYNYLQSTYNLHQSVILSGASMGGLTMGQLLYRKPFPIVFGLGVGPVPGIEIIWNNSPARRAIIRNSYGMAADGSDDANLLEYIKGNDWYKMGMLTIGDDKVKVGFPNTYMYYGSDNTFRAEFGGVAQYEEIANALLNAGVYTIVKQVGVTDTDGHATTLIYQQAIDDGVFNAELGIS
ncbi:hypothetical protein M2459_001334 [Parabacteroides sp. PF5-5]|uniref:hypothetical protein n=1 Tax=unclassified Parabacteroides TaxID=2649774 RepID=UPI00247676EB|nr:MULTISPECIES: hypothetical protein [unclassified Parabacteroides]MDH6304599.1 hypothetical protein [Parabacteroides sp. PH5-39]MDH6315788.1 hypothetical protein [Parabacteroides sp. PF5-13]MDH6319447.1 hypothetical protein [Parabacteroides sp. PH5-13]MDH6323178.1 hypothetical protein [Parabacteroides sp. PH5-8]MDH6326980.1 hypothetical protein [Parabacteroides sp. PH5-41]